MRRLSRKTQEKKFLLLIATLVLLSVLLSATNSFASSDPLREDFLPERASLEELAVNQRPVSGEQDPPVTCASLDLPYTQTPLDSRTALSALDLNEVFAETGLRELGPAFKAAEERYGINAAALAAIAVHESAWGRSGLAASRNNFFGFGAYTNDPGRARTFDSPEEGIRYVAAFLREHYLSEGGRYYVDGTLRGMSRVYAADPAWKHQVAMIWQRLEDGSYL